MEPLRPAFSEPWLTKVQLAERLSFSTRWIELRMAEGLPHHRWTPGSPVRFRLSEVEGWLEERRAAA